MPFPTRAAAVLSIVLGWQNAVRADDYTAVSTTAMGITGDISMDDFSMTFANGASLTFSELVADHLEVEGKDVPASVYRVEKPADPELENGNRLCGSGKVSYVASWGESDTDMMLAVFTGDEPPTSDEQMCASYSYEITE